MCSENASKTERERSRSGGTRRARRISPPAPLRFSPILVRTGAYVRVGRKTVDGFSNAHSIPPLGFLLLLLLILVLHLLTSRGIRKLDRTLVASRNRSLFQISFFFFPIERSQKSFLFFVSVKGYDIGGEGNFFRFVRDIEKWIQRIETILSDDDDDRDGSSKKGRGPSWGAREHWYR